ncbi:dihydrofolate reductase isoform X2 [Rhinoderma darwinii]|uniref:dihydrofolate reductase isoform X2 n=1 Tax=Rhinoderma darwinii TaxID=43563 RepID=UPI003F66B4D5
MAGDFSRKWCLSDHVTFLRGCNLICSLLLFFFLRICKYGCTTDHICGERPGYLDDYGSVFVDSKKTLRSLASWPREPPKGAHHLAKSLDEALELLDTLELKDRVDLVWIIGGSSLYKEVMDKPVNQRLFLTRILQEFECDTFLPEIDLHSYKLLSEYPGISSEIQEENGIQYKFEVYEKML